MSRRWLKWSGIACFLLAAAWAALGYLAQALLVLASVFFLFAIQIPLTTVAGVLAPVSTTITVPRVLPLSLALSALFLAAGLGCFLKLARHRRPTPSASVSPTDSWP